MSAAAPPPLDAPRLDVRGFTDLLDRLDAARAAFDAAGAALANAVRAADAAAMAAAGDAQRAAADDLRDLAAERATLLRAHGAGSLAELAADSRLRHLVSRVGSLRETFRETGAASRSRWFAARRGAAACRAVLDLIARGGEPAATYSPGTHPQVAERGGSLLNAAA